MLYGLERMQGELSEYADGIRGHVRMHANISAIVQFLPEDLGAFSKGHPQIKIDLQEHLSADVLQAVHEGTADIGICNMGQANTNGLQTKPYRTDHLLLVVPQDHPWPSARALRLKKCWNGTWWACKAAAPSAWPCAALQPALAVHCNNAFRSQAWMPCAA